MNPSQWICRKTLPFFQLSIKTLQLFWFKRSTSSTAWKSSLELLKPIFHYSGLWHFEPSPLFPLSSQFLELSDMKKPLVQNPPVLGKRGSEVTQIYNSTSPPPNDHSPSVEQWPSLRLGPAASSHWRLRHADRRKKRLGNDAALPLMWAWAGFVCWAAARAARRPEQGPWKLVLMQRLHNERGRNLIRRPVGSCLYTAAMKCTLALCV